MDNFDWTSMPCVETVIEVPKLDIQSNINLFCNVCPLVTDVTELRDILIQAYVLKRLWRDDIETMVGEGIPKKILRSAKEITKDAFQRLLDIVRHKALDLNFTSRVALLRKQEDVQKECSTAIRKQDFVLASDLQHMYDEMERLKSDFPDVHTMEQKAEHIRQKITRLTKLKKWSLARELRTELDELDSKILVEKKALENIGGGGDGSDMDGTASLSREEGSDDGMQLSKTSAYLQRIIQDLKEERDYASDFNDFATAKRVDEELKKLETLKIQTPSKDDLVASLSKLESDLFQAKLTRDWDKAEEIHRSLLEKRAELDLEIQAETIFA
jgi:hypothetical protein